MDRVGRGIYRIRLEQGLEQVGKGVNARVGAEILAGVEQGLMLVVAKFRAGLGAMFGSGFLAVVGEGWSRFGAWIEG